MTPLSLHQKILGLHSRRTRIINELIEALSGPISSTDRLGVLNGQRDQVEQEITQAEQALTLLLSDSSSITYSTNGTEQPTPSRKRPEAPSPEKPEREQKRQRSEEGVVQIQHSPKAVHSAPKPNPFQQEPASFLLTFPPSTHRYFAQRTWLSHLILRPLTQCHLLVLQYLLHRDIDHRLGLILS